MHEKKLLDTGREERQLRNISKIQNKSNNFSNSDIDGEIWSHIARNTKQEQATNTSILKLYYQNRMSPSNKVDWPFLKDIDNLMPADQDSKFLRSTTRIKERSIWMESNLTGSTDPFQRSRAVYKCTYHMMAASSKMTVEVEEL